jgi:glycosyltransferase involved in cell wall biosynthesis
MSDVFVLPSLIEAFGVVTLEAMAAGKAIVATNLGGSTDATGLVKDGANGFLVSPGDENELADRIIRILQNEEYLVKMGRRSKEIATSFDWSEVTKKYIDAYRTVLDA